MLPIAPLMVEHRLIETMIEPLRAEARRIEEEGRVDLQAVDEFVDFLRTYALVCHQAKEEDLLFASVARRALPQELRLTMEELLAEHRTARRLVDLAADLRGALGRRGKATSGRLARVLYRIADFYSLHIEKEDRSFFLPIMEYFDPREREAMVEAFGAFDRLLVHDRYRNVAGRRAGEKAVAALRLPWDPPDSSPFAGQEGP